jgi:hypothetical protein
MVVALVIAGCAGDDDDTATSGDADQSRLADTATSGDADQSISPIAAAFGYDMDQDPVEAQAEFDEQQRQVQALIVDCMAEQGFEYEPVDYGAASAVDPSYTDLDDEERARTIGYGFTQWVDEDPDDGGFVDPNNERIEAMDDATRDAYYAALYGDWPEPTFDEDGEEVFDRTVEPGGCQNEAWQAVNGGQDDVFRELEDDFNDLWERIEADPRLVEAEAAWSACMAERGFEFSAMNEIFDHLNQRMEEEVWNIEVEVDDEGMPTGPTYDEEGLEEVRAEEIAIATADYECAQETDRTEVQQEVQVEFEEAFIEEHREVFDRAAQDS